MRIIGESDGGFILQASKDEVANLVGYHWIGQRECPAPKVGMEVNVHGMYKQLHDLSRAKSSLKDARSNLQTVVNALDLVDPIIPTVSVTP